LLLFGEDHHILELLFDHVIDKCGFLLFDFGSDCNDGHVTIITLVVVLAFITVSPVNFVLRIELVELVHNFRRSNLCDTFVVFLLSFFLLLLLFLLLVLFAFVRLCLSFSSGFLFRRKWSLKFISLVELG
jgi:phosphatidylserine synthase